MTKACDYVRRVIAPALAAAAVGNAPVIDAPCPVIAAAAATVVEAIGVGVLGPVHLDTW